MERLAEAGVESGTADTKSLETEAIAEGGQKANQESLSLLKKETSRTSIRCDARCKSDRQLIVSSSECQSRLVADPFLPALRRGEMDRQPDCLPRHIPVVMVQTHSPDL